MDKLINIFIVIIVISAALVCYTTINDINSGVIKETVNQLQGGN